MLYDARVEQLILQTLICYVTCNFHSKRFSILICNETLTLKEEQRLRVFENRVLRISGPKGGEITGEWRKMHNERFIICTHHQMLLGRSNQGE
jgi:hypothetical protein